MSCCKTLEPVPLRDLSEQRALQPDAYSVVQLISRVPEWTTQLSLGEASLVVDAGQGENGELRQDGSEGVISGSDSRRSVRIYSHSEVINQIPLQKIVARTSIFRAVIRNAAPSSDSRQIETDLRGRPLH